MSRTHIPTHWPARSDVLVIARRSDRCTVLGPGIRAAIWVQGCPFRCRGCVAGETLPFRGGSEVQVDSLAAELAALTEIEGVTISGGEPMAQAPALVSLIDQIRARRDLSFMCYSGFTLAELRQDGTPAQRQLLDRLDILVDGRFVRERQTDLQWRGSNNQIIHLLSERYQSFRNQINQTAVAIEFEIDPDGSFGWAGIPPKGFRKAIEQGMNRRGIVISN